MSFRNKNPSVRAVDSVLGMHSYAYSESSGVLEQG